MTAAMILEHIYMVVFSIILAIAVGIPLGVCAYLYKGIRKIILITVEILQTVPAMALLGIIMVFLGAGKATVILGLLLYSLLPIVQNTYLGLSEVDPAIKEVAVGMGMTKFYRLVRIELPIAFPLIFTGIRIAAVTAIGIAVFAAFVGGGGLGSVVYRGIHVQNMQMILSGTAALMVMAVVFDSLMSMIEKRLNWRFSLSDQQEKRAKES